MTSNTTEYQREYQKEYRKTHPQKQYKKSKEVKKGSKEVKNKMLEISLARLSPPRAPVKLSEHDRKIMRDIIPKADVFFYDEVKVEKSVSVREGETLSNQGTLQPVEPTTDSRTIDFNNLDPKYQKWALSLETQRHYYYTKFGKVHRKNRIEVKKDLRIKNQELDMVELIKKKKVGLYRDCMKELKQVLEMRKK